MVRAIFVQRYLRWKLFGFPIVLIPAVMIVLSISAGPSMRIVVTYLLFPLVLVGIVIGNFLTQDRRP